MYYLLQNILLNSAQNFANSQTSSFHWRKWSVLSKERGIAASTSSRPVSISSSTDNNRFLWFLSMSSLRFPPPTSLRFPPLRHFPDLPGWIQGRKLGQNRMRPMVIWPELSFSFSDGSIQAQAIWWAINNEMYNGFRVIEKVCHYFSFCYCHFLAEAFGSRYDEHCPCVVWFIFPNHIVDGL